MFNRLKKLAKAQGLTLSELSDQAGLGASTIYSWKYNTPSISKLAKVAKILGVTTDYLLHGDNSKIDISPILNANQLYMKDMALSDKDRQIIQGVLRSVLESNEGQVRLKKHGFKNGSEH